MVLSTTLTEIRDGELRYRGHDAVELVASSSFEDVAELLWTGRSPIGPGGPRPARSSTWRGP